MFVRYKTLRGKKYYQLVRNYREWGKHRQEVLDHLGTCDSLEAAIAESQRKLDAHTEWASHWWEKAGKIKARVLDLYGWELGNKVPSEEEARAKVKKLRPLYASAR